MRKIIGMVALLLLTILIGKMIASNNEKVSLVYLYGDYPYWELIQRDKNSINTVAPSYFDLDENGNLKLNHIDEKLISLLHGENIKITPFLSNHWDREKGRNALHHQEQLVNDLITAVKKYQLDGINIDLENLTKEDREAYSSFVSELRRKMPSDKVLSVAVAANPAGISDGWQGSYDYQALSKVVDYLVIMAYDEHFEGGESGAVAGISFFEKSIQYALSQVSNQKIVVGVPFYGRYWKEGEEIGGYGITTKKIEEWINRYHSVVTYDSQTESVKTVINIEEETVSGRKLTPGEYIFYYEDQTSMQKKIELVKQYDLKGIAAWSLGQESNSIWSSYRTYLNQNSKPYIDVDETHWANDSIYYVTRKEWMIGRENQCFMPNEKITRAEFVNVIANYLGINYSQTSTSALNDVEGHWAQNAIHAVAKTGLIQGYEDNTFRPNQWITREEVAQIFNGIIKNKSSNDIYFRDVTQEMWSYQSIQNMAKNGILKGYENHFFRPKQDMTRAEVATLLMRSDYVK